MRVHEIVKQWLEQSEYDGLYIPDEDGDPCACNLWNICDSVGKKCRAGYSQEDVDCECDEIGPEKSN